MLTVDRWQRELDVAIGAVRAGARVARDIREEAARDALLKSDRSPVTIADFAVQAVVAHRLGQTCPDDPLVAEEDATALGTPACATILRSVRRAAHAAEPDLDVDSVLNEIGRGGGAPAARFWTLDPVDGTEGFVRGDRYVVALALVVSGRVEVGVLGCPGLALADGAVEAAGAIVVAVRNHGAFRTPLDGGEFMPLRVSECSVTARARVLRSFAAGHIDMARFNDLVERLGVQAPPVPMDSQAKHAVVASGQADALIRIPATRSFRDKIWDHAAGSLVVEEAGGRVTDLHGAPLDFGAGRLLAPNEGVIASNGRLHQAILDAAAAVFGRS